MIFNHKLVLENEHKYIFSYEDAFGVQRQMPIPTCVYYNLNLRISGTASNLVEYYLGQVTETNHLNRCAKVIIAEDRYLHGRYFEAIKLYDIVWIFEHFQLDAYKLYTPEYLITSKRPLYFNIHSVNIEYLDHDRLVGTIRVDPYTGHVNNQDLLDGLARLREQYV